MANGPPKEPATPKQPASKAAAIRTFTVTSRPANDYKERDDPNTIYGVRTIEGLSRAFLKKIAETSDPQT
jgi:hypothetical protein